MVRTVIGRVNRPINAGTVLFNGGGGVSDALRSPLLTFDRDSAGWYTDPYGRVRIVDTDIARVNNSELVTVNYATNPWGLDYVKGVIGEGGVMPPWWNYGIVPLRQEVIGHVEEDGIPLLEIRFSGVATANNTRLMFMDKVPTRVGETWTSSFYLRSVRGTIPDIQHRINAPDEVGEVFSPTSTLTRYIRSRVVADTSGRPEPRIGLTIGEYYDFTLRFGGGQFELGNTASPLVLPPRGQYGPATKFRGNRLLIEQATTNLFPNPQALGGPPPTGWTLAGGVFIGTGVEDGIPYADYSFTTSASTTGGYQLHAPVAVAPSGTYTGGYYIKLVGGSVENLSALQANVLGLTSGGAATINATEDMLSTLSSSAPLSTQRKLVTGVMNGTTEQVVLRIRATASAAGNATYILRIGMPHLEEGEIATSPGVVNRAEDSASVSLATLQPYRPLVGNMYTDSETFGISGTWSRTNTTVNEDVTPGPYAGTLADAVVANVTNTVHSVSQPSAWQAGVRYSISAYCKAGAQGFMRYTLPLLVSGNAMGVYYNLTTGAITTAGVLNPACNFVFSAKDVGGGWWRCSIEVTSQGTYAFLTPVPIITCPASGVQSFAGDGVTEDMYIWGAQVSVADSTPAYMKTTTTAIAHHSGTITGVVRFVDGLPDSGTSPLLSVYTDADNYMGLWLNAASGHVELVAMYDGVAIVSQDTSITPVVDQDMQLALTWDTASGYIGAAVHDGGDGTATQTVSGLNIMPAVTTLGIGDIPGVPTVGVLEYTRISYQPYATPSGMIGTLVE